VRDVLWLRTVRVHFVRSREALELREVRCMRDELSLRLWFHVQQFVEHMRLHHVQWLVRNMFRNQFVLVCFWKISQLRVLSRVR